MNIYRPPSEISALLNKQQHFFLFSHSRAYTHLNPNPNPDSILANL